MTASGTKVSHIYVTTQALNVRLALKTPDRTVVATHKTLTLGSWNRAVGCTPTLTTLERIVGNITIPRIISDPNSTGADYARGGYDLDGTLPYGSNSTVWPFFRRDLSLPCAVNGTSNFVEFHNVTATDVNVSNCGATFANDNGGESYPNAWQSCDTSFNLVTPGFGEFHVSQMLYSQSLRRNRHRLERIGCRPPYGTSRGTTNRCTGICLLGQCLYKRVMALLLGMGDSSPHSLETPQLTGSP